MSDQRRNSRQAATSFEVSLARMPFGVVAFLASGGAASWMARRTSPDGPFVRPRPVTELNSTPGESPNWLSPDGCRIYLTSDRTGSWQLYVAERSPD